MKHLFLTFALAVSGMQLMAQSEKFVLNDTSKDGTVKFRRFNPSVTPHYATEEKQLLRAALGITGNDSLANLNTTTDKLGFTHNFYQQYYKGIKVEYATYATHIRNGIIETINGSFAKVGNPNIKATITFETALAIALKYTNALKYKWQDSNVVKTNPKQNLYPKGELVICFDDFNTKTYRLAYKILIEATIPSSCNYIFVDAVTGAIVSKENLIFDGNPSVGTRYSGTQTITTTAFTNGSQTQYRLRETRGTNSVNLYTFNSQRTENKSQTDFVDANDTWTVQNNTNMDNAAFDAHWATEKVYDYWNTVRGRSSYNGANGDMVAYVHYNTSTGTLNGIPQYNSGEDNAFWDGNDHTAAFGDGLTHCNPLVSLDAVAHEFGHGFTQFANSSTQILVGSTQHPETIALNEGISDIWGAVVENWAAPTKQTWKIGEEVVKDGSPCLRSLANPKTGGNNSSDFTPTGGYPDTYHGTYWDTNNEPHTNSTVISHWFYLLSVGGSGTNDNSNTYSVTGIGIDAAAAIVWHAEQNYFGANSEYIDARNAMISAATDIYGTCSNEVIQVTNAWYAVGVGASPLSSTATVSGTNPICSSESYSIANLPSGATNIHWAANPSSIVSFSNANTSPTTISKIANGITNVYASFNTSGGCVVTPIANIQVGADPFFEQKTVLCPSGNNQYIVAARVTNIPSATSYKWYIDGVLKTTSTDNSASVAGGTADGKTHTLQVKIQMACGLVTTAIPEGRFTARCGSGSSLLNADNPLQAIETSLVNDNDFLQKGIVNKLQLYPNPATNSLTITLPKDSLNLPTATITITDISGRRVKQITTVTETNTIPVSTWANGTYVVTITDGTQKIVKKIVKN